MGFRITLTWVKAYLRSSRLPVYSLNLLHKSQRWRCTNHCLSAMAQTIVQLLQIYIPSAILADTDIASVPTGLRPSNLVSKSVLQRLHDAFTTTRVKARNCLSHFETCTFKCPVNGCCFFNHLQCCCYHK